LGCMKVAVWLPSSQNHLKISDPLEKYPLDWTFGEMKQ
jgi:hypothetical protein